MQNGPSRSNSTCFVSVCAFIVRIIEVKLLAGLGVHHHQAFFGQPKDLVLEINLVVGECKEHQEMYVSCVRILTGLMRSVTHASQWWA